VTTLERRGGLLLVRHGESEGNATRTFTATPEVPITELGRRQARAAGQLILERYAPVRLVASSFRRAIQTAQLIGEVLELEAEIEPDVREQDLGELHGKPYESARDGYDGPIEAWRPPGGETLLEVQTRAIAVLERLIARHPGEQVVVVTHGGTTRAVWAYARDWKSSVSVPNGGVVWLPHHAGAIGSPELIDGAPLEQPFH
jgi:broad specificity phosphatase PhoE